MPKTRNYSEREKRDAMDLLDIHDDIHAVHMLTGIEPRTLRRWRKKLRRRQNATLSGKDFSLSAKRTKLDKVQTQVKPLSNPASTPFAFQSPPDPYPDDSEKTNHDLENLRHIRAQLMIFARRLADNLDPDDPDVNLQTMSLSRVLDRIYWLDENLYDGQDEETETSESLPPNRIAFVYEEGTHEQPPWHNASSETD